MIKAIYDAGISQIIYYLFHVFGFIGTGILCVTYAKKYKFKLWQSLFILITVYGITYFWLYVAAWIESGFKAWGGNNIVRIFVYLPLFAFPVAKLFKRSWGDMCDFLAPMPCMVHAISHLGCIFAGCCCGYPSSFGFYNPVFGSKTFPIQPIEAIVALGIVIFSILYAKKYNYNAGGRAYSLMMIIFGSTRFFLEFCRNNDKMFMGISNLAIHAFVCFAVGVVAFTYQTLKKKKVEKAEN